MKSQFDELVDLLGRSLKEPTTINVFAQLAEAPRIVILPEPNQLLEFSESGVGLTFDQSRNEIWSVSFVFDSADIRRGKAKPFSNHLLCGIAASDQLHSVEQKLERSPLFSMDIADKFRRRKYQFDDLLLDCFFDFHALTLNVVVVYSIEILKKMGMEMSQLGV